jgi:NitT/TauT family transport system ATP-binding protein
LLEYLDARGGKDDVFRIASDTNREFGHLLNIVEAAELLNFVDTPKRLVVLDATGKRYVKALPAERKAIWREQLLKLRLFRDVYNVLQRQADHAVEQDFVLETIVLNMPHENYERVFQTFVRWARVGNLFVYDEARQILALDEAVQSGVAV